MAEQFIFTTLFSEDFTTAALQDPLSVGTWRKDNSGSFDPSDTLAVVSNTPPPGIPGNCCQTSAGSLDGIGFGYWTGNPPSNGFVQASYSFLSGTGGLSLMYSIVTPRQLFGNGGFYMQVNGPLGTNAGQIQLIYEPGGGNPALTLASLDAITLSEGDVVKIAYEGISHYGFLNGVQIFDVDYAPAANVGGALTTGLSTQVVSSTDVQILNVQIGTTTHPPAPATQFEQHYTLQSTQKDKVLVNVSNTVTASVVHTVDDITQQLPGAANQTAPGSSAVPPPAPPLLKSMPPYFVMKNPA